MQFYYDSSGKCIATVPERVVQNSVNATTVFFIGAFPSTSTVTCAFILPNQIPTNEFLLTCVRDLQGTIVEGNVNEEQIEKIEQTGFNIWNIKLPIAVTKHYGTVTMNFYVRSVEKEVLATETTFFSVLKGSTPVLPDLEENEQLYNQILGEIAEIKNAYANLTEFNIYGTYPYVTVGNANVASFDSEGNSLANKLDKSGGTVEGDLTVQGDFTVKGKVTSVDVQTVKVEDNIFLVNSKQLELADLAGVAINTGSNSAHVYGIMYDPVSDSVKIGDGRLDENGDFHYYLNEDQNLATVDWTIPNGNLAKFNQEKKTFEDSGISADNVIPKIWRY